jgi:iron complex outermembrane receptor protein
MGEYYFPVLRKTDGEVDAYLGADWSLRSSFYAAVNLDPFSKVNEYQLLGLHAGVRYGKHWDASFWMRNALDEHYLNTSSVTATYGVTYVEVGEPRMLGATLRGEFM